MGYWIIIAEQDTPIPVGTIRVIERQVLDGGRIRWIIEGADFMNVLAGVVKGILSVQRYEPDSDGEGRHSVA